MTTKKALAREIASPAMLNSSATAFFFQKNKLIDLRPDAGFIFFCFDFRSGSARFLALGGGGVLKLL
ncbi:MAG: hypothetical protein WCO55_04250 [Candidatus Falkowbacteria bacterium]